MRRKKNPARAALASPSRQDAAEQDCNLGPPRGSPQEKRAPQRAYWSRRERSKWTPVAALEIAFCEKKWTVICGILRKSAVTAFFVWTRRRRGTLSPGSAGEHHGGASRGDEDGVSAIGKATA